MDFPYLKEEEIAYRAAQLLWDYEQRFNKIEGYQIPIEEIAETHPAD